jgi:hypothetical protein
MKKLYIIICLIFTGLNVAAQLPDNPESELVSNFRLNLAVPDLPAFKALGTEPSKLLRPSIPQAFSIVSSFLNSNSVTIPKSFAAEFAPYILLKGDKMTLKNYQDNSSLYNLRISVGTSTDTMQAVTTSNAAIGLRMTLIDKGDFKNDPNVLAEIAEILKTLAKTRDELADEYLINNNLTEEEIGNDKALQILMNNYIDAKINEKNKNYDERIKSLKDDYRKNNWNKEKFDISFAMVGQSRDTLAENLKLQKYSGWISYAYPVSKWGQLIIGINSEYNQNSIDNKLYFNNSLGARLYIGTNKIKGFLEGQLTNNQLLNSSTALYNLGAEVNIADGFWLNFYTGALRNNENNRTSIVSHLDLRFTIPENFKLF